MLFSHNNKFTLAFPTFICDAVINDEIMIQTTPTDKPPLFISSESPLHEHNSPYYVPKRVLKQIFGYAF